MAADCIGDYRTLKLLGKGQFGEVYMGERRTDKKRFALKSICTKYVFRGISMDRILREVESHKSLPKHENILDFIESISVDGYLYIVLELCELGTLEDYVTPKNPDRETAWSFMVDLARGLNHLHSNGIVHRDIKPENVLLAEQARGAPRCKISDFGVARIMDIPSADSKLDVGFGAMGSLAGEEYFNTLCGTPIYLAPEVRDKHYTKHCDIFSLGVVFYVLFSPERTRDGRLSPWVKNGTLFYVASDYDIKQQIEKHVHDEGICELILSMLKTDYHSRIPASALEEALLRVAVPDDEVFFMACFLVAVTLMFLLFPAPLFVLALVLLTFGCWQFVPRGFFRGIL
ncbi:serine/threonine-protein kinase PDIK1L-like [Haliotis cracherodii]|uniref:serine/threonine-protein kinase PDIK1L-like n=1 Tax=Haliotis cracherodii TaxID=6455 RepID=UPI0039EB119F